MDTVIAAVIFFVMFMLLGTYILVTVRSCLYTPIEPPEDEFRADHAN